MWPTGKAKRLINGQHAEKSSLNAPIRHVPTYTQIPLSWYDITPAFHQTLDPVKYQHRPLTLWTWNESKHRTKRLPPLQTSSIGEVQINALRVYCVTVYRGGMLEIVFPHKPWLDHVNDGQVLTAHDQLIRGLFSLEVNTRTLSWGTYRLLEMCGAVIPGARAVCARRKPEFAEDPMTTEVAPITDDWTGGAGHPGLLDNVFVLHVQNTHTQRRSHGGRTRLTFDKAKHPIWSPLFRWTTQLQWK